MSARRHKRMYLAALQHLHGVFVQLNYGRVIWRWLICSVQFFQCRILRYKGHDVLHETGFCCTWVNSQNGSGSASRFRVVAAETQHAICLTDLLKLYTYYVGIFNSSNSPPFAGHDRYAYPTDSPDLSLGCFLRSHDELPSLTAPTISGNSTLRSNITKYSVSPK